MSQSVPNYPDLVTRQPLARRLRGSFAKYLMPFIAIALLAFGLHQSLTAPQAPSQVEPPATPPRSPFANTIAAAGVIEPQTENISIGSALAGIVTEVAVSADRIGSRVQAGDPLFRVDDRQLRAQLAVKLSELAAAESQLARIESLPRAEELPAARERVAAASANLTLYIDQWERAEKLFADQALSEQELVSRRQMKEAAAAELARSQADLELLQAGAWEPDKAIARATIDQVKAQVEQIKIEIERSLVRAPVDGEILQVDVRPGEFVGTPPGKALIVLGDIRLPRVRVDIDEHDIPRFRSEGRARAQVRGDDGPQLELKFVRIEPFVIPKRTLTGSNTERVDTRVLQVIYTIESPAEALFAGQQVDVFIEAPILTK